MGITDGPFPQILPPAIASYDYTDIAEGTGTKYFYGLKDSASGSINFRLTSNADTYSSLIETIRQTAGTDTFDFDTQPFNLPKTVKGTAYVSIPWYYGDAANYAYTTAQLQKISNSVVTDVSEQVVSTQTAGTNKMTMQFLSLPLTQTILKKGDQIRLVIRMVQVIGTGIHAIGHDPMGRSADYINSIKDGWGSSALVLHLPFKIDL